MGFFLLETLKTTFKMRNLIQYGHNQSIFCPKLRHFFSKFWKRAGETTPLPPLAPDRVSLIIKSLLIFSEIIIVLYSENSCYVKELRVLYVHEKYTMAFCSNTNLVFIIVLKIAGFCTSFSSIFKIIFHNFLCCFQNSYFENVIHSRKLHAYCHVPNYNGVKFYF